MTRTNQIITFGLYFLLFVALQVFLFMHFSLLNGMALCFVYITFILMIPYEVSHVMLMVLAFFLGLVIDIFYNTPGVNASASVAIAFLRPYIIKLLTPRGGYDEGVEISVYSLGIRWFFTYAALMVLIHHFILFMIWTISFGNVLLTLGKTVGSTLFTLAVVVLIQYLIHTPRRA